MNEEQNFSQEELIDILGLPLKDVITKDDFETNRRIFEEGFRNVIISLEKTDPISNYIDLENKPFFNVTKIMTDRGGYDESLYLSEDGMVIIECDTLKIKEIYCPICGNRNYKFDNTTLSDIYKIPIESNKYFNKKTINGKSFKYISCDACLDEISDYIKQNPKKKIRNPLLYSMYIKMAKALGLEELENSNDRVLFPNDICTFGYKNRTLKLNLFNLGSIVRNMYLKFVEIKNLDEIEATTYFDKILTKYSVNLFNKNDPDFLIYREFEDYLLKNSEPILLELINKFPEEQKGGQMSLEELQHEEELKKQQEQKIEETSIDRVPIDAEESTIRSFNKKKKIDFSKVEEQEESSEEKDKIPEHLESLVDEDGKLVHPIESNYYFKDKIETLVQKNKIIDESTEEKDEIRELTEEDKQEIVEIMDEADKESEIGLAEVTKEDEEAIVNALEEVQEKLIENTKLEISEDENEIIGLINENAENLLADSIPEVEETPTFELSQEQKTQLSEVLTESINEPVENNEYDEEFVRSEEQINSFMNKINKSSSIINKIAESAPLSIEEIKEKILTEHYPSKDEIFAISNELKAENKTVDLDACLDIYIERKAQEIDINLSRNPDLLKEKYGLDLSDLKNYIYHIKDKYEATNQIEDLRETTASLVVEDFNPEQFRGEMTFGVEDEEHYNYTKQKQKELEKEQIKKKNKFSTEIVFQTPNFKKTTPFEREKSLIDDFNKSVFKKVFDAASKYCDHKCGKMVVTINEKSGFVPVIDFPDVGIRFVCVDTGDIMSKTYELNPVKLSYRVPFANPQYKTSYSLNIVYSNECATKPDQVANHISKLIGWKFLDKFYHVTLSEGKYPIAYTTEAAALSDFEHAHSIFASETARVKNGQITLVAFVPHDKDSVSYQKRFQNRQMTNGFNDLLHSSDSYYVASAHYTKMKLWTDDGTGTGNKEPYILYTITQYTENMFSIVLDGLPAIVSGIIKEHYREFGRTKMSYAITFENDITQLYSPSIRFLLNDNRFTGIFEDDPGSYGQAPHDTVTSYIINEDRFKTPVTRVRNDNCRTDFRLFVSNEDTFRKFMAGKIDERTPIDDRHKLLMQLGYKPYPEPRPFKLALTNKALDQLENSSLFKNLFEIKIGKINDASNQESYNNVLRELSMQRMLSYQDANMEPGAKMVKAACDILYGLFNKNKQ